MEIAFVLGRRKRRKEGKTPSTVSKFQGISDITIWVPNEPDIINGSVSSGFM